MIGRKTLIVAAVALVAAACDSGPGAPDDGRRAGRKPRVAAAEWERAACRLPARHVRWIRNGYYRGRSPEVSFVPRKPHFVGGFGSTTHSGPWTYLQEVPLVLYGPGFIRERGEISLDRTATVADLAPTVAELLGVAWPDDRPGRVLSEALVPEAQRPERPRVVVVIVWDGGGWNVLRRWPDAWPRLARLIDGGTSIAGAAVGSSPSVTPAIHASIGTGAWPAQHGIVDIPLRMGGKTVGSYGKEEVTPKHLVLATLGDLYDASEGNRPIVGMFGEHNWHLGMMGHGAFVDGGDKDIAVLTDIRGRVITNPEYYRLPGYLESVEGLDDDARTIDIEDGRADGKWLGHDMLEEGSKVRRTPAWILYQTRLIEALFANEGIGADDVPDLFFTNYKQLDLIGHDWNMVQPEVESALAHTDAQLDDLTALLDERAGEGRWVVAITADHGQQPEAEALGSWPIALAEMAADAARHFGTTPDELFDDFRPTGMWLDRGELDRVGIAAGDVAAYLTGYTLGDNVRERDEVPAAYRDRTSERLVAAAFPTARVDDVYRCASRRRG